MRVLLLPLSALALAAPAPPAAQDLPLTVLPSFSPYPEPSDCPETPMSLARKSREQLQLRPLDELPDGQAFAAVDRGVGGCPSPMSLNEARSFR